MNSYTSDIVSDMYRYTSDTEITRSYTSDIESMNRLHVWHWQNEQLHVWHWEHDQLHV